MNARRRGADEMGIFGLGLCTPLGLTARTTQVEMAAGTVRFFETDVVDTAGEPVRASLLPLMKPELTRTERMTLLAVTAFQEVMKDMTSLGIQRLPLLLALPEPGSGSPFELRALLRVLTDAAGPVRLETSEEVAFSEGRAGFFHALAEASLLLRSRQEPWVLVGGVDSLCDRDSLTHHARTYRSLGPNTRDGILPGEGAGFFLLASPVPRGQRAGAAQGCIVACSLSREPNAFLQRRPNLAEGLTETFRQLRQHPAAGTRRVDHLMSCQTGETFWTQEFSCAYLRNAQLMPEPLTMSVVAESLGDVGAAAGAIQLGSALYRLKKLEQAHGTTARVLIYGCADAGQTGACIIEGENE